MRPLLFGYRARTAEGQVVTDRVEALSEEAALQALRARGLHEVQMLDSDHSAIDPASPTSALRLRMSATDEQALRRQRTLASRLWWTWRQQVWSWGALCAWCAYGAWQSGGVLPVLPTLALLAFVLWFAWAQVPVVLYHQALWATAWARWDEVGRRMAALQRWKAWFKTPFPEHEMLMRSATALAGQGRLAEALAMVAPVATMQHGKGPAFYTGRLASIYDAAGDYRQVAELQRQAHALAPTTSTAIDLAATRVRRLGDLAADAELLAGMDPTPLSPAAQLFFYWTRGVAALNSGDPQAALRHFEPALRVGSDLVGTPIVLPLVADASIHCGLALAALGRGEEARRFIGLARPLMLAHGETGLLARADAALAAFP